MQAEAKALSADERHAHRATEGQQDDLGLPIGSNHFRFVGWRKVIGYICNSNKNLFIYVVQ